MIVLDELDIQSRRRFKRPLVVALKEEAPLIAKHLRLKNQHFRNSGRKNLHSYTFSERTRIRYSPYPLLASGLARASSSAAPIYPFR